jgi:hypothetical protein
MPAFWSPRHPHCRRTNVGHNVRSLKMTTTTVGAGGTDTAVATWSRRHEWSTAGGGVRAIGPSPPPCAPRRDVLLFFRGGALRKAAVVTATTMSSFARVRGVDTTIRYYSATQLTPWSSRPTKSASRPADHERAPSRHTTVLSGGDPGRRCLFLLTQTTG